MIGLERATNVIMSIAGNPTSLSRRAIDCRSRPLRHGMRCESTIEISTGLPDGGIFSLSHSSKRCAAGSRSHLSIVQFFGRLQGEKVMERALKSHPVDIYVGTRMRLRRTLLGMSQATLGDAVGLTFQQVQKYERGFNRISASRLYEFAKVLDVPVSYFFDEMPFTGLSGRPMSGRGATPFVPEKDPLIKRETLELVRAYYKIHEKRVRKRIFEMVKAAGVASHAEAVGGRRQRKSAKAT